VKRVIALCGNKKGETCIVTGGNATIGFETAATLAAVGYHVILGLYFN
jgi:NAD(P)-dependent dehydrogenase (short-subunit alcohol dehydrogenase family)